MVELLPDPSPTIVAGFAVLPIVVATPPRSSRFTAIRPMYGLPLSRSCGCRRSWYYALGWVMWCCFGGSCEPADPIPSGIAPRRPEIPQRLRRQFPPIPPGTRADSRCPREFGHLRDLSAPYGSRPSIKSFCLCSSSTRKSRKIRTRAVVRRSTCESTHKPGPGSTDVAGIRWSWGSGSQSMQLSAKKLITLLYDTDYIVPRRRDNSTGLQDEHTNKQSRPFS